MGDGGTIVRGYGDTWTVSTPDSARLRAVWARSSDDVFAAGDDGTVLHYDGEAWQKLTLSESGTFEAVAGTASATYLGIGNRVVALNDELNAVRTLASSTINIRVLGIQADDAAAYATTTRGSVIRFNNSGQVAEQLMQPAAALNALAVAAGGFVAVGNSGAVFRGDGSNWQPESDHLTTAHLLDIWASSPDNIVAVGGHGEVLRYDGRSWKKLPIANVLNTRAVWIDPSSQDVFLAGTSGQIARFDGANWHSEGSGLGKIYALWGTASDGDGVVFAAGENMILRRRDDAWTSDLSATGSIGTFKAISGNANATLVVAVGDAGKLFVRNGEVWMAADSGTTENLFDVWVGSSAEAVAVGARGTISRMGPSPSSWALESSGTGDQLRTIAGPTASSLVIVGLTSTPLRRSRNGWVTEAAAAPIGPQRLLTTGGQSVLAGNHGAILRSRQLRCSALATRNNANQTFYLDADGTLSWSADVDRQHVYGRTPKPVAFAGDFDGDGFDEIATRPAGTRTHYLDTSGDGVWDARVDARVDFGLVDDHPIAGDWNGDATDSLGVYRPSTGMFYLDSDENRRWEQSNDRAPLPAPANALPLAGDWDGSGQDKIGIFEAATGRFVLDLNDNGVDGSDPSFAFGQPGDLPFSGDWNCDGRDEIGIFRPSTGEFLLDYDGDGVWQEQKDRRARFDPGIPVDQVVSGRW